MVTNEENAHLDRTAMAFRRGQIKAQQFLRETHARWRRLGRRMYARWRRRLPAWVGEDDVVQELEILVLLHVKKWKPGKAKISQYLTWCAIHRTQRTLNRWRGASTSGNEGKNPSRAEIAFAQAFTREADEGDEGDRDPADRATVEADQDEWVEAAERFDDVLQGCLSVREALSLLALRQAGGKIDEAAKALFESFASRVECGLSDERHARRVVTQSVAKLADRYEDEIAA
jgi:hypothetical protein